MPINHYENPIATNRAMTLLVATMVVAATLACGRAGATSLGVAKHESPAMVRIIALHAVLLRTDSEDNPPQYYTVQCPLGYIPTRYSVTAAYGDDGFYTDEGAQLIDRYKTPLNRSALASAAQLDGAGYIVALVTVGQAHHATWHLEIVLPCLSREIAPDNSMTLVKASATAAALKNTSEVAYCPAEAPVALGGFSNADAKSLKESFSAPAWGTPSNPVSLREMGDGQTGAPNGWQSTVWNPFNRTTPFVVYAICANAAAVQTFIYSTTIRPEETFSVFAPVPEGWNVVGHGADGGAYGVDKGFNAWIQDGWVVNFQAWYLNLKGYDAGSIPMRAYIAQGVDGRIRYANQLQPDGRAVAAVLAIPESTTLHAPTTVDVIEFYNAKLDHYFITGIADEISDLDNAVHAGWTRTGQNFKAYAVGSQGPSGRRPVCRAYGTPEAKLNSHFYSASVDECFATIAKLGGAWLLEASEVFAMDLPDPITGACPAGTVPVYRTWNNRADSNHRYTTSIAMRDQMVAKGYIAEGYGPNRVTLCALQ